MSETKSVAENYEKIQKASAMVANYILFSNISQLVEYRRNVAIDMLKCQDEETHKALQSVYERSEYHLKQLLAL